MTTSTGLPLKILNKGPGYFRERMLSRDSGFARVNRRSAVELLEEMKPLYVKSKSVCETRQSLNNADNLHVGLRRSQTSTFTDAGRSASGALAGTDPCDRCLENQRFQPGADGEESGPCKHRPRGLTKSLSHTGASWESGYYYDAERNLHVPGEDKLSRDNADNGNLQQQPDSSTRPTNVNLAAATNVTSGSRCAADTEEADLCHRVVTCMEFSHSDYSSDLKRPRYNNNNNGNVVPHVVEDNHGGVMEYNANKPQGEATTRVRQQEIPTISAPEEWGESRGSPGAQSLSEMDQQSSHGGSLTGGNKGDGEPPSSNPVIRRRHKKAISRSRSDLTKRCSGSSDLSELSARFSRNSADLEKFFNEMGLDKSVLEPMIGGQCPGGFAQSTSSLHVFSESVSSVSSPTDTHSWCSGDSQKAGSDKGDKGHGGGGGGGFKTLEFEERLPATTSVVERNARIIKWLCSVKKAGTGSHHDSA